MKLNDQEKLKTIIHPPFGENNGHGILKLYFHEEWCENHNLQYMG
jgi:hypothetical protein